jgi:putative colanic acid biosynthesis acetyltransferase WcaF
MNIDLSRFDRSSFDRGRPKWVEVIWRLASTLFFRNSCFPFYGPKRFLLRCFGAKIGRGVLVKPDVKITFPWRLSVGDFSWIGEEVWIDSLAPVEIDSNVCISQRSYLCTGSHNSRLDTFDLITQPIRIRTGVWVGACSILLPGVTVGEGSFIKAGSVVKDDIPERTIVEGNPAKPTGVRTVGRSG